MSQSEILRLVHPDADQTQRTLVSQWERAAREPLRHVLIRYARLASVSLDAVFLDECELPRHITETVVGENGNAEKQCEKAPSVLSAANDFGAVKILSKKHLTEVDLNARKNQNGNGDFAKATFASNQSEDGEVLGTENEINEATSEEAMLKPDDNTTPDVKTLSSQAAADFLWVVVDEPTEAATLYLPSQTLDELHDLHLELVSRLPRRLRASLTPEGIVNFCVKVIVMNYQYHQEQRLIFGQFQLLLDSFEEV